MSELRPELRPDKNGHMVTRWVRKDQSGSLGKRGIPDVSGQASGQKKAEARARKIARIARTMVQSNYFPVYGDEESVAGELSRISDETLKVITDSLKRDRDASPYIDNIISSLTDEPLMRELIHYYSDFPGDANETHREALVVGLKEYDIFAGVYDLSEIEPKRRAVVVALLNVGYHVIDYVPGQEVKVRRGLYSWDITDEKLLEIVLANPEKADEISRFIKERKTGSGEAVADYLDNMSALREGNL